MLVGIVGGKLQGVEAAYLARKAGWQIRLVDRNNRVPAVDLVNEFVKADVTDLSSLGDILGDADLIVPALENDSALRSLTRWCRNSGVPLAFDYQAYAVSSSKLKSAELFSEIGLPVPDAWPRCDFPVLVKPGRGSGSKGVHVYRDLEALKKRFATPFPSSEWVVEEYVDGSQHSLEIIGRPGNYRVLQVTDLFVDQKFDCKRVVAPSALMPRLVGDFEKMALTIAEALNLCGIMDLEVIQTGGELKVLEIDARLPSQTPTAVYWSTGDNMVSILAELNTGSGDDQPPVGNAARGVVYEHIRVSENILSLSGERIMTKGGPLHIHRDFFGADEAITNYSHGKDDWVATLIYCETNRARALEKRKRSIAELIRYLQIKEVIDRDPGVALED